MKILRYLKKNTIVDHPAAGRFNKKYIEADCSNAEWTDRHSELPPLGDWISPRAYLLFFLGY
jgi:hypothetical protein